jgi:hypothetical protein
MAAACHCSLVAIMLFCCCIAAHFRFIGQQCYTVASSLLLSHCCCRCCIAAIPPPTQAHPWVRPGHLFTKGPGTYKIPTANDIPLDFRVTLMQNTPNPRAVHSSKVCQACCIGRYGGHEQWFVLYMCETHCVWVGETLE